MSGGSFNRDNKSSIQYFTAINSMVYPWVPEKLCEDHQVSRVQSETHVSCSDRQHSHAGLGGVLKLFTQLLPFSWGSGPVNTDVTDILKKKCKWTLMTGPFSTLTNKISLKTDKLQLTIIFTNNCFKYKMSFIVANNHHIFPRAKTDIFIMLLQSKNLNTPHYRELQLKT